MTVMMRKSRGLRLGRRLVKWWVNVRPQSSSMSKICNCWRSLKKRAKGLSFMRKNSDYIRVGSEKVVPKGHLAVYVGDKEDERCRVLVPVIYFNHPLFANLLREAEMVYGYDHEGGIQIPCEKAQFENVKMKISAASGGGSGRGPWSCIKVST